MEITLVIRALLETLMVLPPLFLFLPPTPFSLLFSHLLLPSFRSSLTLPQPKALTFLKITGDMEAEFGFQDWVTEAKKR